MTWQQRSGMPRRKLLVDGGCFSEPRRPPASGADGGARLGSGWAARDLEEASGGRDGAAIGAEAACLRRGRRRLLQGHRAHRTPAFPISSDADPLLTRRPPPTPSSAGDYEPLVS
ncbi:hypothetical protein GUJ93_ZPchr0001g30588 [Zizania palustris]|uniref:Uncharacterized protein n=1 Tax=Zizania palustris TaxID=103762 RepID=A0A8J5RY16_ZIZPA|nr:hypothetical protein GUJ93_ZPchr0001g30588 [Zizania palustris]